MGRVLSSGGSLRCGAPSVLGLGSDRSDVPVDFSQEVRVRLDIWCAGCVACSG
jgi:hypothetical protein